jgi:hypothetical protein
LCDHTPTANIELGWPPRLYPSRLAFVISSNPSNMEGTPMKVRTRVVGVVVGTLALIGGGTAAYGASVYLSLTPGAGNTKVATLGPCGSDAISNYPGNFAVSQNSGQDGCSLAVQVRFIDSYSHYGLTAKVYDEHRATITITSGRQLLASYHWAVG